MRQSFRLLRKKPKFSTFLTQAKYVQLRVLRGVKDANPRDPAIIWPNWGRGNPGLLEALEDYTAPPDPLCLNYDEY